MPGNPTFAIGDFSIRPKVPETWSFSALRGFEECPKRWALSRSTFSCFGGPIPQQSNKAGLEGTLLHELIEQYERHTRISPAENFRPRRTLLELVAAWARRSESNPRINSKLLAGQVRLEEILRMFNEASNYVKRLNLPLASGSSLACNRSDVFNGSESWLRDPKSKLCGRADFISSGEIIDFKSGEKNAQHVEQIVFYGALYLAITGRLPTVLRLVYTVKNEVWNVPIPALNELEHYLDKMRQRASIVDEQVAAVELPAKPELAKCAHCHVRGLCGDYWQSLANRKREADDTKNFVDYAPTVSAVIEQVALGIYVRDNWAGIPSLLHIPQEVAKEMGGDLRRLRILSLRVLPSSVEEIRFALTQSSEIYIL
jgi:hypothetical protein